MHPASPVCNSDFVRYHMAGAAAKLKYHSLPVLRCDCTAIAISPRFHQALAVMSYAARARQMPL
jgi:hypothetical protein